MIRKIRGILIFLCFFNIGFAEVEISEVAWMGTSTSSYDEWIEIYNSGDKSVDLSNWKLAAVDGTPSINLSGEIPAKSYFLLERTDDTTVEGIDANIIYSGGLENSGEELILFNAINEEVDKTPSGHWPEGENETKKTMERINFQIYGDKPEAWQTFISEGKEEIVIKGTPGKQNSAKKDILSKKVEFVPEFEEVKITRISPVLLDSGESWIEFSIKSDYAVDITDWEVSNGQDFQKFSELGEDLVPVSASENFAGVEVYLDEYGHTKEGLTQGFRFKVPENRLIFSPKKKEESMAFAIKSFPLDLSNDRSFEIKNTEKSLATKSFAKDLRLLFSEISPKRDKLNVKNDFFELLVADTAKPVDVKFLKISHNGKDLFFAKDTLIVEKNDVLTFNLLYERNSKTTTGYVNSTILQETGDIYSWNKSSKNNINNNSGTMELVLWSGTSWEKMSDFVCWEKKKLSKIEQKRVWNNAENWQGDCVKIQNLAKNESIARSEPQTDTNSKKDFYRHFHGSPGERNFVKNHSPHARIKKQSGKLIGETKVNFTGLEKDNSASVDGDGLSDLKYFKWKIDGKACGDYVKDGWSWINENCYLESQKSNPGYMKFNFNEKESFKVSLKVTDITGASDISTKIISREIKEELPKEKSSLLKNSVYEEGEEDFFSSFLENTDIEKLKEISQEEVVPIEKIGYRDCVFARDRFSIEERGRIAKNIGLIFQ